MSYLLDANVFIQAKNQYYGFDIAPGFWKWLIESNASNVVFSVEKVADELIGYGDELSDWPKERRQAGTFFLPPDDAVADTLKRVAEWANAQNFADAAVSEFLQVADYYLVAHALAHGHTVVTQERYEPDITRRIKNPNVCVGLGVPWMDTYSMLRAEGVKLGS